MKRVGGNIQNTNFYFVSRIKLKVAVNTDITSRWFKLCNTSTE